MLKRLERKAREQNSQATVLRAPAEDLPFEDASFDTVVSTLVLCGVDDQPRVVRELRRVLRPGGRLIFIEHVRSDDPHVAKMQDRMNPVNRFFVCCDCNRRTLETIGSAGFEVTELEHTELPKAPPFVRPLIVGSAQAPRSSSARTRSSPSRRAPRRRWGSRLGRCVTSSRFAPDEAKAFLRLVERGGRGAIA
jgi:SAM-dependent methyltransferase